MKKPVRIGITIGDINGVGPEVSLRAALRHRWPPHVRLVLIGSAPVLARQARALRLSCPPPFTPESPDAAGGKVTVWDPAPHARLSWTPGALVPAASSAAAHWIREAVAACQGGILDAMVTAPICKEGFHAAGIDVPGHTELLAELTHTRRFAMMLFGGPIRVILVTRHLALREVADALSIRNVYETIQLAGEALPWLGLRRKRISVCGLNPHAGDGGKIGREEITIIGPAIRKALRDGLSVTGPVPADTVFHQALQRKVDAIVAMYHDQGLAPLKMFAFDFGINVTLGLPIVRTSPDHGTAFDIAGKNRASPRSMIEAIDWAAFLARRKNPWART